ncbi:hypothetical protein QUB16_07260 [Microcoleus sp. D3_18a_C4]
MPIPQELFFLVGWASCPSNKFMKRTFARGLKIKTRRLKPLLDKRSPDGARTKKAI